MTALRKQESNIVHRMAKAFSSCKRMLIIITENYYPLPIFQKRISQFQHVRLNWVIQQYQLYITIPTAFSDFIIPGSKAIQLIIRHRRRRSALQ